MGKTDTFTFYPSRNAITGIDVLETWKV